jgi:hypothetical protein
MSSSTSFKNVVVLVGLTTLVGGAEISKVNAATMSQTDQLPAVQATSTSFSAGVGTGSLSFNRFDVSMGTLTEVQFSLASNISATGTIVSLSASANANGQGIGSPATATGPYDVSLFQVPLDSSFYEGTGTFSVLLFLVAVSPTTGTVTWDSPPPDGSLAVTYTFTPAPPAVPLPAALPLFATGLAGLGFTTWRSRRKQKTKKRA